MKQFLFVLLALAFYSVKADFAAYSATKEISIINSSQSVLHYHNWRLALDSMILNKDHYKINNDYNSYFIQYHFSNKNHYSFIQLSNKDSVLFKKPCPALTSLYYDSTNQIIVGLSSIKLRNPIRFVLLNKNGDLIHSGTSLDLEKSGASYSESVTNVYNWLSKKNPQIKLTKTANGFNFSFNDIKDNKIQIPIITKIQALPNFNPNKNQDNLLNYPDNETEEEQDNREDSSFLLWLIISLGGLFLAWRIKKVVNT